MPDDVTQPDTLEALANGAAAGPTEAELEAFRLRLSSFGLGEDQPSILRGESSVPRAPADR